MLKAFFPAAFAAFLSAALPAFAAPRIATSDWTVAETLAAMGLPPVAVGDKRVYGTWVGYPPLPERSKEAGLRFQPNLERLRQIQPDFFVQSKWYAAAKPQFEKIAPVYELDFGTDTGIEYAHTLAATRRLAKIAGNPAAGEKLIADTEAVFAQAKSRLAKFQGRPVAAVQFDDGRYARIYGKTSLYQVVFDKVGLKNAWTGKSDQWGLARIPLTDLAKLPRGTVLVIVPPHPRNTRQTLEKSALWKRLPFSQPHNRRVIPPAWSYGALPAMQQFARRLAEAMPSEKEMPW
ncbi:iron-siderophore ABC transporter substrate-binding protein [Neisseria sp.]|uniref:iron-siderophore ABC transporter substrate-binding protein n=1 Tax=Neisseria sp. TaxID=192066 RepID=UPI00359FA161